MRTIVRKTQIGGAVGRTVARVPDRTFKASDLVGAHEIGARLHVEARSVHSWVRRYSDFPPPIAKLRGAWVWAWPDVEAWAKATGRK